MRDLGNSDLVETKKTFVHLSEGNLTGAASCLQNCSKIPRKKSPHSGGQVGGDLLAPCSGGKLSSPHLQLTRQLCGEPWAFEEPIPWWPGRAATGMPPFAPVLDNSQEEETSVHRGHLEIGEQEMTFHASSTTPLHNC